MVGKFLLEVALLLARDFCLFRESEKGFSRRGVKCKRCETHVRRSTRARSRARARAPPPSKRNLAGTIEYRIFNTPPGNAKRGARQWLFLGTDSRSFILTWRFLYEPIYGAAVVARLGCEIRERVR